MNIERRRLVKPKKVFICSPFAPRGETKEEMQKDMDRNIRITQRACRYAALNGNVPYAPHLFFTQFLKDSDKAEREYGQIMGLIWLAQCSELWIIGRRISPGMEKEIRKAKEWGIPVKHYVFKRDLKRSCLIHFFIPMSSFLKWMYEKG